MKLKQNTFLFILISFISYPFYGQDISLFKQYNGRYDFVFIGNTLNTIENNNIDGLPSPPCTILTNSSSLLNLNQDNSIENAYLYWAGSGTGDFEVKLNNQTISAIRTFSNENSRGFPFFSAFADVTSLIQSTGNGIYNFSDLDLTAIIADYCPFGGNFAGWAIVIIYKNKDLPLNQLTVYDGLQSVPNEINITLNSLNVIDNNDAKIGFVAWEGDKNIANNESLLINENLIDNPPLNPGNNAFNGTNSFLGTSDLYNMDLDVYSIQNNIKIGDTNASIRLTSDQDFVMINAIVTKLNSQLPDATISFNKINKACNSKKIVVDYTVFNSNSTNPLPAETPIAIYANGILIQQTKTKTTLPIDGSETATITINIPENIPNNFELKFIVDDDGTGQGRVNEINETNNTFSEAVTLLVSDILGTLDALISCNLGLGKAVFNFSKYEESIKVNPSDVVQFYESTTDLENETNTISGISNYSTASTPKTIFVKVDNGTCFSTTSFSLTSRNCPPTVYNFVSANNDTKNDTFFIDGLRNIFLNFKLSIYNRWGTLVWNGNNNTPDWDGYANQGFLINSSQIATGTYYYVLELNDPDYSKPLVGYLFLTR
ncbi:T9SS type B sorting domain-containing protein [Flavobacterium luteum]|uniref:T9SS type B sorting domain-containing protein n=1 Tax=Flavobacterium luteum TaxID=2026654 RepID=A0A7J5ACW3_9FLAO|nr:gliding motility-associated C-terminal domain-containing protein [Flavobacterium luteum]KAB1154929.1 T9SS type B sorting domain-containing protein [Flavobacterium luteum]